MISWQSSPLNLEALEAPRNHWPQNRNIGWPKLLLVSASNWGTRFALRPCKMVCWGPKKQDLNASLSASVWTHNMPVAFSRMDCRWLQKSMMVSWNGCNKSLNRQPAQIQKTEPCQSSWAQAAKPKGPWRWTAPKSSLAKKGSSSFRFASDQNLVKFPQLKYVCNLTHSLIHIICSQHAACSTKNVRSMPKDCNLQLLQT